MNIYLGLNIIKDLLIFNKDSRGINLQKKADYTYPKSINPTQIQVCGNNIMCPDAKLTKENKIEIEIGSTLGVYIRKLVAGMTKRLWKT
jgi:hypothetical protein